MKDLSVMLLFAGGALAVFGPLCFILLALDGRERRYRRAPRLYAKAALWSGFVIYAGLAAAAFLHAKNGPADGPPWEFVWSGVTRMPFLAQFALAINGLAVLWAWWILRDEEDHPDRAMVDAALAEEREAEEWRKKDRAAAPWTPPTEGR